MYFYLLTTRAKLAKGIVKMGYFKGTLAKLRQRYITCFPNLIIYLSIECDYAKQVESLLKLKFLNSRVIGQGGRRSEWVQCNVEKLVTLVHTLIADIEKFAVMDCEEIYIAEKPRAPRQQLCQKRKRMDPAELKMQSQVVSISTTDPVASIAVSEPEKTPRVQCTATKEELQIYVEFLATTRPDLFVPEFHRPLLVDLLWVVCTKNDFDVSLDDIVDILKQNGINKQKSNLQRQFSSLQEGKDYREVEGQRQGQTKGKPPIRQCLTIDAFKMICIHARTPIQRFLTSYFLLTEDEYRTISLQEIRQRP